MNKGFTLVELLVVVLIIGILAAVALPQYTTAVEKARSAEALTLMNAVAGAAERYRLQKDSWPAPNDFAKLDIEVPTRTATTNCDSTYGGKNFCIYTGQVDSANPSFIIVAKRNLGSGQYCLKTELSENANGTISSKRCCTTDTDNMSSSCTAPTANSDAEKYCAAITNGNMSNF